MPGQVFEVSDEMRMGTRLAGRIAGARLNFVDLDQTVTDPAGSNDKLSVVMKDGTIETRDIASFSGNRVTLASNFTQVPPDDALYAIKNDSNVLRKYRCLSVAEGEGGVYAVTGVRHVDSIYSVVDAADSSLDFEDVRTILGKPAKPTNVKITFLQVDDGRNTTVVKQLLSSSMKCVTRLERRATTGLRLLLTTQSKSTSSFSQASF